MAEWMHENFGKRLRDWFKENTESLPSIDPDVLELWPEIINCAEAFDLTRSLYLSADKPWLATIDGILFMTKVARQAVTVAKSMSDLTSLVVWKDLASEKYSKKSIEQKAKKLTLNKSDHGDQAMDETDSEDEHEEEMVREYQGEPMKPEFSLGKEMPHLSIVNGLESWGENNWIEKVYFQMGRARSVAFGAYNIYGIERMDGNQYCISVDCYMKNLKPTEKCFYEEGFVTGRGDSRIIATVEAAMFAYWKIGIYQLKNLVESKLQSWPASVEFFNDVIVEDENQDGLM